MWEYIIGPAICLQQDNERRDVNEGGKKEKEEESEKKLHDINKLLQIIHFGPLIQLHNKNFTRINNGLIENTTLEDKNNL